MKTTINLTRKLTVEIILENLKELGFNIYCFAHTLINNRKMFGKVFWSSSDCYIEIGKTGYIAKNRMYDLNNDITIIQELILNEKKSIKINLSESEVTKIQKLASLKNISIRELLLASIDKFQQTENIEINE